MALAALLSLMCVAALDIDYFHTGIFFPNRDPGLYEVDTGLRTPGHMLAAFGYFDGDKL